MVFYHLYDHEFYIIYTTYYVPIGISTCMPANAFCLPNVHGKLYIIHLSYIQYR